jgi:outer membrane biosynthesis protein TonB
VNNDWYCKIVGIELGPMSFGDLTQLARRGNLRRDHFVRHGATGAWILADSVPDLCSSDDPSAASLDFDMEPIDGTPLLPFAMQGFVKSAKPRTDSKPSQSADPPTHVAAAPRPREITKPPKPASTPPQPAAPPTHVAAAPKPKENQPAPPASKPPAPKPAEPKSAAPKPAAAAPAKPKEKTKPPKPAKAPQAPKHAKPLPSRAGARKADTGREKKLNGKLVVGAVLLVAVSLAAWALFGRGGRSSTPSAAEISDGDLIAACRQLHEELKRARGTELTAQTLNGFEMEFQKKINSLRFQMRGTPAGSARQSINSALSCLNEMPRCAVNPSDSSAYKEREEKMESMLAEAAMRAGI